MRQARQITAIVALLAMMVLVTGCFKVEQAIDLRNPKEGVGLHMSLQVDKTYSGSELDLFVNVLHMTIPAIQDTAQFTRLERKGPTGTWVVYEWRGNEKYPLEDMPFALVENTDGTYDFQWTIPAMEGFSEQTESDTILLSVEVALPREIDFANTMDTDGVSATWDLRKPDLAKGVRLRAMTF